MSEEITTSFGDIPEYDLGASKKERHAAFDDFFAKLPNDAVIAILNGKN